ncbi:MAG: four helix bundle protein [Bacteroidia bacterium]|nr:four helix bundle protein [Bacteroidia bacterium]
MERATSGCVSFGSNEHSRRAARPSKREYYRFLGISRGSLSEMDTELELALRQGYISKESEVFPLLTRASYLLDGLMKHVWSQLDNTRLGKK